MEKIHASKLLAGLVPAGKLTSDPEVALVTTDSREVKPGCIFVAFPGERFDGHDFAARALEQAGRARICHLTDPAPDRVSYLMTRRGEALSPAAQLLLEDIRTEIQRIEGVHMVQ